jgi:hypothetical protein
VAKLGYLRALCVKAVARSLDLDEQEPKPSPSAQDKIISSKTTQNPHVNPPPHRKFHQTPISIGDFFPNNLA